MEIEEKYNKIKKHTDELYENIEKIYSKMYKNDNTFFISGKIMKHLIILMFLSFNIIRLLGYWRDVNFIIFNLIILLGVFLTLVIGFIWEYTYKPKKCFKLTDEEWNKFKDRKCFHVTSRKNLESILEDGIFNIKPTKYILANLPVLFRESVYFFGEYPSEENLKNQYLQNKKDVIISVPINNLDRNKLRIRRSNNVLVYIGGYKGKGSVKDYTPINN